ncbi:hypothetical protein FLAN108750_07530 [Flavobacterium antarcticum]|uniref:hypothetical protein n=1 Tax=Flavobacterium antarcticum TaxID=271155 RepID=UPI0003B5C4C1|nr:hypothetical protein [Flavobacterium antarcticum]
MKNILIILILCTTGLFAQNRTQKVAEYSDWNTFKNPYEALQIRYKLEKKDGDVGYYKAQIRINFDEPTICKDQRCQGYALSFGIPSVDDNGEKFYHYKIFFSYKENYTIPDLIPIKLSFSDGSKRFLKSDGFYYQKNDTAEPQYLQYFFIKSADLILEGSRLNFKNFIESEAITLK